MGCSRPGPEFVGSTSHNPLEHPAHVLRILEAQAVCNLAHRFGGRKQFLLRSFNQFSLNVLRDRLTGLLADHVAEIVRGKEDLLCKIPYRRQADFLRSLAVEVFVEQSLEA